MDDDNSEKKFPEVFRDRVQHERHRQSSWLMEDFRKSLIPPSTQQEACVDNILPGQADEGISGHREETGRPSWARGLSDHGDRNELDTWNPHIVGQKNLPLYKYQQNPPWYLVHGRYKIGGSSQETRRSFDCEMYVADNLSDTLSSSDSSLQSEDINEYPSAGFDNLNIDSNRISSALIRQLENCCDYPTTSLEVGLPTCDHTYLPEVKEILSASLKFRNNYFGVKHGETTLLTLGSKVSRLAKWCTNVLKKFENNTEIICIDVLSCLAEVYSNWPNDRFSRETVITVAKYLSDRNSNLDCQPQTVLKLCTAFSNLLLFSPGYRSLRKATILVANCINVYPVAVSTCTLRFLSDLASVLSVWGQDPTLRAIILHIASSVNQNLEKINIDKQNVEVFANISVAFSEWLCKNNEPLLKTILIFIAKQVNSEYHYNRCLFSSSSLTKICVSVSRLSDKYRDEECLKMAILNIAKFLNEKHSEVRFEDFTAKQLAFLLYSFGKWASKDVKSKREVLSFAKVTSKIVRDKPLRSAVLTIGRIISTYEDLFMIYSIFDMGLIADACTKWRNEDDYARTLKRLVERVADVCCREEVLKKCSMLNLSVLVYAFSKWYRNNPDEVLRLATLSIAKVVNKHKLPSVNNNYKEYVNWRLASSFYRWPDDDYRTFLNATLIIANICLKYMHTYELQSLCNLLFAFSKWRKSDENGMLLTVTTVGANTIIENYRKYKLRDYSEANLRTLVTVFSSWRFTNDDRQRIKHAIVVIAKTFLSRYETGQIFKLAHLPRFAFSLSRWIDQDFFDSFLNKILVIIMKTIVCDFFDIVRQYTILNLWMLAISFNKVELKYQEQQTSKKFLLSMAEEIQHRYEDMRAGSSEITLISYFAYTFGIWAKLYDEENTLKKTVRFLAGIFQKFYESHEVKSFQPHVLSNFARAFCEWYDDEFIENAMTSIVAIFENNSQIYGAHQHSPKTVAVLAESFGKCSNASYNGNVSNVIVKLAEILNFHFENHMLEGYDTESFRKIILSFGLRPWGYYNCESIIKATVNIIAYFRGEFDLDPLKEHDSNFFQILVYSLIVIPLRVSQCERAEKTIIFIAMYMKWAIENYLVGQCKLRCMSSIGKYLSRWHYLSSAVRTATTCIITYIITTISKNLSNIDNESLVIILNNSVSALINFPNYPFDLSVYRTSEIIASFINEQFEFNRLDNISPECLSNIMFSFVKMYRNLEGRHLIYLCIARVAIVFNEDSSNHLSDKYNTRSLSHYARAFVACSHFTYIRDHVKNAVVNIARIIKDLYAQNPGGLNSFYNLASFAIAFSDFVADDTVRSAMEVIARSVVQLDIVANALKCSSEVIAELVRGFWKFSHADNEYHIVKAVVNIGNAIIKKNQCGQLFEYPSFDPSVMVGYFNVWLENTGVNVNVIRNVVFILAKMIVKLSHKVKFHIPNTVSLAKELAKWYGRDDRDMSLRQAIELIAKSIALRHTGNGLCDFSNEQLYELLVSFSLWYSGGGPVFSACDCIRSVLAIR